MRSWKVLPLLLGLAACGGSAKADGNAGQVATESSRYAFTVDRVWRRGAATGLGSTHVPDADYVAVPAKVRWTITFDDPTHVTVAASDGSATLHGSSATPGTSVRTFDLDKGTFAGGRLVVDGTLATLTVFGSGVAIVSSERGTLQRRS